MSIKTTKITRTIKNKHIIKKNIEKRYIGLDNNDDDGDYKE